MAGELNNEQQTKVASEGAVSEPEGPESGARDAAAGQQAGEAAEGTRDGVPRRKRKRRRSRRRKPSEGAGADGSAVAPAGATDSQAPSSDASESQAAASSTAADSTAAPWQTLAAGLFSHLDDRRVPCMVDGCPNTWGWSAQEQMQAFGKPPPRRMCAEHRAEASTIGDREVPCANPGCTHTWTWTKSMQRKAMQRTGSAEPPRKVCPHCVEQEQQLVDRQVPCRIDSCARTWTWAADAQLKHRVWARKQAEEDAAAGPSADRGGSKRRGRRGRRRRRPDINEPPPRLCAPCQAKLAQLEPREGPCKVHGCTRTATIDRESQLRAWAQLRTDDPSAEGTLPRRMCETCRDFCRSHPDREVPCGRPGCERSWTYKTGAQLQDFLAGRRQDPIRLCDEDNKGGALLPGVQAPGGMELMPCVVPMCDGVWFYREGVVEVAANPGDTMPVDRMCDRCRQERGAAPRAPAPTEDPAGADSPPDAAAQPGQDAPTPTEVEVAQPGAEAAGEAAVDAAGAANEAIAANEAVAANEPVAANEAAPEPQD